jgi:hypothetical protein
MCPSDEALPASIFFSQYSSLKLSSGPSQVFCLFFLPFSPSLCHASIMFRFPLSFSGLLFSRSLSLSLSDSHLPALLFCHQWFVFVFIHHLQLFFLSPRSQSSQHPVPSVPAIQLTGGNHLDHQLSLASTLLDTKLIAHV